MGAYSTITISREDAIESLRSFIDEATNEQLGDMLYAGIGEVTLSNYAVVDYGCEPSDDQNQDAEKMIIQTTRESNS